MFVFYIQNDENGNCGLFHIILISLKKLRIYDLKMFVFMYIINTICPVWGNMETAGQIRRLFVTLFYVLFHVMSEKHRI